MSVESGRLVYVLIVSVLAIVGSFVSSALHLGWLSAWVVTVGALVAIVAYAWVKKDGVLARLLVFGLVAAAAEIVGADRWAVQSGTLVYAPHGPFILDSPAYMLASWTVATTQFSLLGLWLVSKLGNTTGALACAVVGGTNLPMYESLAFGANWWEYKNVPMILHAPWYVILGEVAIGVAFPWFGAKALNLPKGRLFGLGLLLGAWMFVSGWAAFQIVGR